MIKIDYYRILGVSRDESAEGIRAAFRRLAKMHHPDKGGAQATRFFQEITEAYEVLSDPAQREAHTRELRKREGGIFPLRSEPSGGRQAGVDFAWFDPKTVRSRFRGSNLSFDEVFIDFFKSFPGFAGPFEKCPNVLRFDLVLSPEEAAQGGAFPMEAPVSYACPTCRGSGTDGLLECETCGGRKFIQRFEKVRLKVPAGVPDGAILEAPVGWRGPHLLLRMRVRIDPGKG